MLTNQTMNKLNSLRLFGMAKAYGDLLLTAKAGEVSVDEALGILVDREATHRDNRATKNRLKRASLREQALVEDINWRHPRNLDKAAFKPLISCEWIQRHQNIIFVGPTGIGKTWLACALAHKACSDGFSVSFHRVPRLPGQINTSRGAGDYEKFMRTLLKTDLLVLDDWGQALAEQERRDIMEIVEDRFDRGSTIITTQLPIENWHEVIGDPTMADAIVDRIVNRAHIIKLKGPTVRDEKRPGSTRANKGGEIEIEK